MRIDSGIAPGQVLQRLGRSATATISGPCTACGPIAGRLLRGRRPLPGWRSRMVGAAADGRFTARLADLPIGGPYRLELTVGRECCAVEFYVGDVWLMAGQSNMEGIGDLADAPPPHPLARCLHTDGTWRLASDPLHLPAASPDRCHTAATIPYAQALRQRRRAGKGTGVGVWFAREMLRRTPRVPQGLIACAHGGTSMTQWDPALKERGGDSLYGSMLRLWGLTGQRVAGMLWYQGESECTADGAAAYRQRMINLVAALRRDLDQPRLPWVMVQIAGCTLDWGNGPWWEAIREQQRLLPGDVSGLSMVSAIDLLLDDAIHIAGVSHAELGRRLARQMCRLVHRDRRESPEPVVTGIKLRKRPGRVGGPMIEVRCRHVVGGWRSSGRGHGFAVVRKDGSRFAAIWRVTTAGDRLQLHLDPKALPDAVALVHGPGMFPCCDIRDGRGAPLPAFGPLPLPVQPDAPAAG